MYSCHYPRMLCHVFWSQVEYKIICFIIIWVLDGFSRPQNFHFEFILIMSMNLGKRNKQKTFNFDISLHCFMS